MRNSIAVFGLCVAICSLSMPAWARIPSAIVVGVNELADGETLANCKDVLIQENEIFISKQIGDLVRGKLMRPLTVYIEPGLTQPEDISNIVLYQSARICEIFLAKKSLSPLDNTFAPIIQGKIDWSVQDNGNIHLSGENQSFTIKPGTQKRIGTYDNTSEKSAVAISIYNHGRLPLWEGFPNHPLSCTTHVKWIGSAHYSVNLRLSNESAEAMTVYALDTGTVWWYKGKELISAAVPGHEKQTVLLNPGTSIHYISAFEQDPVKEHLHAEIRIPGDKIEHRVIRCEL